MPLGVVVSYIACALIWGTTFFAIRVCIAEGGYPTWTAAALRFALASIALGAVVLGARIHPRPSARTWPWLLLAGLLNGVGYALVYRAEESIPGGLAAVLFGTLPLASALFGALTKTERPRREALFGSLVSLGGIALIVADRLRVSTAQAEGVGMLIGSVVCCALYNVVFKRHAGATNPLALTAAFLAVTAAVVSGGAAVFERAAPPWPPPFAPTVALVYLALIGSVVAFASYFYLLRRVRLSTVASLVLVEPVIALLVDAFWERQRIEPRAYLGVAVTLAGVFINFAGERRRAREVAP